MEDIQVIIYILFGIIYFIFRVLKNKQETKDKPQYGENKEDELGRPHEEVQEAEGRPKRPRSGTSLEDILRELSGDFYEGEEEKPKQAPPKKETEYKPLERREVRETPFEEKRKPFFEEEEERQHERAGSEKYRKYETTNFDKSKKKEKKGEKKYKTLDEQVDIESFEIKVKPELQELEGEGPSPKFTTQYAKMLKNPDEAKKAIVLSEIINRKYD